MSIGLALDPCTLIGELPALAVVIGAATSDAQLAPHVPLCDALCAPYNAPQRTPAFRHQGNAVSASHLTP
ncbi:MAG: hypothetical protein ACPGU1_07360 [Myxococcota bacterium]